MRTILFKGKRKDNGKWVEGYVNPCVTVGKWHICRIEENLSTTQIEIDPNTICQFTGLTDKNGQKIWENDIVTISAYAYEEPEDDYTGIVYYSEWDATWYLKDINNVSVIYPIYECYGSYVTEIFNHGNIFDNPELLEVEE